MNMRLFITVVTCGIVISHLQIAFHMICQKLTRTSVRCYYTMTCKHLIEVRAFSYPKHFKPRNYNIFL